ncbi:MAG: hypothetical protein E7343_01270 [Clostridiales bacterium]|nr:hypothetical protein [Clostridiales bacterium]
MLEFLSENLKNAIKFLNLNLIFEIRIRAGQPTTVNYNGSYSYLGENGIVKTAQDAVICTKKEVEDMVYSAGNYSVYAVEEQIRQGFISANGGVRVGLAGEYVYTKGQPVTIKNIRSLCVRVPHKIIGVAKDIFDVCFNENYSNLLILSPPGQGKTTILRDIARIFCEKTLKNILICDERGEISMSDIGFMCDIISFSDKKTAFEVGIRAMRPDIMITDEITKDDIPAIKRGIGSGVTTIASAHLKNFNDVLETEMNIFEKYVVLDDKVIGKLSKVLDKNGECLYENVN